MKIVIQGHPIAQQRHRDSRFGGKYNPQAAEKKATQLEMQCQLLDAKCDANPKIANEAESIQDNCLNSKYKGHGKPLSVEMTFYTPYKENVKSVPQNSKFAWSQKDTTCKDVDNYLKFYLDAGNEVLWPDDHFIYKVKEIHKRHSIRPRTEIEVLLEDDIKVSDFTKEVMNVFTPSEMQDLMSMLQSLNQMQDVETFETLSDQKKSEWLYSCANLLHRIAHFHSKNFKKLLKISR